jgi:hypothetical protein
MGNRALMDTKPAASTQAFTVLDWIGTLVTGSTILSLMVLPLAGFGQMFRDLGGADTLPLLTRVALLPGFTVLLALPAVASFVIGLRSRRGLSRRRIWIVVAFGLGCLGHGICAAAMYVPIFSLSGKIKSD